MPHRTQGSNISPSAGSPENQRPMAFLSSKACLASFKPTAPIARGCAPKRGLSCEQRGWTRPGLLFVILQRQSRISNTRRRSFRYRGYFIPSLESLSGPVSSNHCQYVLPVTSLLPSAALYDIPLRYFCIAAKLRNGRRFLPFLTFSTFSFQLSSSGE